MNASLTPEEQEKCDYADELAQEVVEEVFSLADGWEETSNVIFCIFIWTIHHLVEIGWSPERLQEEVARHGAMQECEGPMQ